MMEWKSGNWLSIIFKYPTQQFWFSSVITTGIIGMSYFKFASILKVPDQSMAWQNRKIMRIPFNFFFIFMSTGICPGGWRTACDSRRQKSLSDPMLGRKEGGRKWHSLWATMWVLGVKPRFYKATSPLATGPSPQSQWWILEPPNLRIQNA